MDLELTCPAPEDTLAAGEAIGRAARPGLVILLQGPLGAGKTLLTKGIARGLGVATWRYVTSPTFAIHNLYHGRLALHHMDLYRLEDGGELEGAGLEEVLYAQDVCVIEWPDSFFEELPPGRLLIQISWDDCAARTLQVAATGEIASDVVDDLRRRFGCSGDEGGGR